MKEPKITPEVVKDHGLSESEYKKIIEMLGREPNFTELGLFSVMWSEHCCYKNSRPLLKTFPKGSKKMLVGAGEENAGVVDIGNGWAVSFKIESHNHPSAVEPFQGAATGVGGIIRDIFTMGARPVALLNSLRFGSPKNPRTHYLVSGVVSGIAHYGNCIGIPTVGGDVYFEDCYDTNPLVNAACVGVMRHSDLAKGSAQGVGNSVMYVGAATGRDGIHGATFASEDLTEESEKKRPAVQVGDPFMEKLLMEACLELLDTGHVVGIQDMGAAGLACSTSETAARGNSGLWIDLSKVPQREEGMIPYEILCSESQERMLVIVKNGHESEVERLFEKWDLHAVKIGEVTEGEDIVYYWNEKEVARVKAKDLTDNAPVCEHPVIVPSYYEENKKVSLNIDGERDLNQDLLTLAGSLNLGSRHEVYEQYDHMVQANTVSLPGSDSAVVEVPDANAFLALTTDCNGRYCWNDPYNGTLIAVCEAARNIIASGGEPLAISNCLNFGNPYQSEVYWQLKNAVDAIGDASLAWDAPITGGNVSLYNQNPKGAVYPTPVIQMVGLIKERSHITRQFFKEEGLNIYLLGQIREELGASEYGKVILGEDRGEVPQVSLEEEVKHGQGLLGMIRNDWIESAHDLSDGGLAIALMESTFGPFKKVGATVDLPYSINSVVAALFGETQGRYLLTAKEAKASEIEAFCKEKDLPLQKIGKTGGDCLTIRASEKEWINQPIHKLYDTWKGALSNFFSR